LALGLFELVGSEFEPRRGDNRDGGRPRLR